MIVYDVATGWVEFVTSSSPAQAATASTEDLLDVLAELQSQESTGRTTVRGHLVDESDVVALLDALPRCRFGDDRPALESGECYEHARARDARDDEQRDDDEQEALR